MASFPAPTPSARFEDIWSDGFGDQMWYGYTSMNNERFSKMAKK